MSSGSSSAPHPYSFGGEGGVVIHLSDAIRNDLIKSRQALQQQQRLEKTTALLHSLSNTTVRTSLAAVHLATATASTTTIARTETSNEGMSYYDAEEEEQEADEYKVQYEKELDEELMLLPSNNTTTSLLESSSKDEDDDDGHSVSSSSSVISLSPPSSLPVLVISLEKLCGYIPQTREDYLQQKHHVEVALYGAESLSDSDDSVLSSLHFSKHASELLEFDIAIHSDTNFSENSSTCPEQYSTVTISYPEYILVNNDIDGDTTSEHLQKVSVMWKHIQRTHPIPVVERLLKYLRICNRDMQWKYRMALYLRGLSRQELFFKKKQSNLRFREEFKLKRKNELEKLYQTREVFESQLEDASNKLYAMQQQRNTTTKALDLANETFDFLIPSNCETEHLKLTQFGKSTNEIYAETLVRKWEGRLAKLDELLETMQDDEWADEEGEEDSLISDNSEKKADYDLSLVDQILAMIFGKLTLKTAKEHHFQFISLEHQAIINEWKAYFGRLPPPIDEDAAGATTPKRNIAASDADFKEITESMECLAVDDSYNRRDERVVDHWEDLIVDERNDGTDPVNATVKLDAVLASAPRNKGQKGLRPGGNILML